MKFPLGFKVVIAFFYFYIASDCTAQNSMVGDGFGGRSWYVPFNFTVGSYSAFTVCGDSSELYGWGYNHFPVLGDSDINSTDKPVKIKNIQNVKFYTCGYMMAAILQDNSGWIWGVDNILPKKVIDSVYYADAGMDRCIFVKLDGTVWNVGYNNYGAFGSNDTSSKSTLVPKQMLGINNAVRAVVGGVQNLVLLSDNTVWSSGLNIFFGLGNSTDSTAINLIPKKINLPEKIVDIKSTTFGNAALTAGGDVYFWGLSITPNVKDTSIKTPSKLIGLRKIVAISGSTDGDHFLFLDEDGNCYGLGDNSDNQIIEDSSIKYLSNPKLVATGVADILAGETFSYLIKSDATLWATGIYKKNDALSMGNTNPSKTGYTKLNPTNNFMQLCKPNKDLAVKYISRQKPVIYNVFSPNGDNINDFFEVELLDWDKFSLRIYNRYGVNVFESNNTNLRWNGKVKNSGSDCPDGTYFYELTYHLKGHQNKNLSSKKGALQLIR